MTEPPRDRTDRLTSRPVVNALGPAEQMRQMMGPFGPDNAMRQAVTTVWRYLPEDARTIEGVEQETRRLLGRSLQDLREDFAAFSSQG